VLSPTVEVTTLEALSPKSALPPSEAPDESLLSNVTVTGAEAALAAVADRPMIEELMTKRDVASDKTLDFLRFIPVPFSMFGTILLSGSAK
jgi:hypothetical protein